MENFNYIGIQKIQIPRGRGGRQAMLCIGQGRRHALIRFQVLTCLTDNILLLCRQGRHYIARGFLTKMKPDVKYLKFLQRSKLVVYGQKIDARARHETEKNSQVSNWNFYYSFRFAFKSLVPCTFKSFELVLSLTFYYEDFFSCLLSCK